MRLYVMRHGIAEDGGPALADFDRPLSDAGRARLGGQCSALVRAGWTFDAILASPLLRAQQTAAMVADALSLSFETDYRISLGAPVEAYLDVVRERSERRILCVGHQPDLAAVVFHLTGARVHMRKGTLADIDLKGPGRSYGVLKGLYDPEVMAAWGQF